MAQTGFEQELRDDSRVFGLSNWKLPFMELPFIKFESIVAGEVWRW